METVRSKISNHPQLYDQDPKKVLDKIRAQWRFQRLPSPDITSLPRLPTDEKTLQERVQRGLKVGNETPTEIVPLTNFLITLRVALRSLSSSNMIEHTIV